ncbi:hypothetical protein TB2_031919 [Malus domestica]
MTRSSPPISANMLGFDDNFEQALRRKRKKLGPNSPSFSSEFEVKLKGNSKRNKTWLLTIEQSKRTFSLGIRQCYASMHSIPRGYLRKDR